MREPPQDRPRHTPGVPREMMPGDEGCWPGSNGFGKAGAGAGVRGAAIEVVPLLQEPGREITFGING